MGFRLARQNAHTFEKFIDSDFSAMFYAAMKPISICAIALAALPVLGAPAANYDEAKVPDAPLPDALAVPDGSFKASCALEWQSRARPKIAEFFESEVYGKRPPRPQRETFKIVESSDDALGGKALRRQIKITVADAKGEKSFIMLLYLPKSPAPAPVFVGLNFMGNHATAGDPEIIMPEWVRNTSLGGVKISDNKPSEKYRGLQSRRWPYEKIISRGFGVATIYYCDIYPDLEKADGAPQSVYSIFKEPMNGAIAAWSWGLSRALDALETVPQADAKRVVAVGHSRLGKTALHAAAFDGRFAGAVSNDSGCMGAALSRRQFGETVEAITRQFPFWFSPNLNKWAGREAEMPADQHQMLALVAPRPLYVASASEDLWADPRGEFLSLAEASKVYALFGAKNLPSKGNFAVEKPFIGDVGYHMRKGRHDMVEYDWENFCNFFSKALPQPR